MLGRFTVRADGDCSLQDDLTLLISIACRDRQIGQPAWQVGSGMQKIDDNHLLRLFDKDDEMLACTRETQIFFESRVNQPSAIL